MWHVGPIFLSKIPTYVVPTLYPLNRLIALTSTTNHIYIYISLHSTPSKSHICQQHQRLYCPPFVFFFQLSFPPLTSCNSTYIRCISSGRYDTYALLHAPPLPPPFSPLYMQIVFLKAHGLAHHIWTLMMIMIRSVVLTIRLGQTLTYACIDFMMPLRICKI